MTWKIVIRRNPPQSSDNLPDPQNLTAAGRKCDNGLSLLRWGFRCGYNDGKKAKKKKWTGTTQSSSSGRRILVVREALEDGSDNFNRVKSYRRPEIN